MSKHKYLKWIVTTASLLLLMLGTITWSLSKGDMSIPFMKIHAYLFNDTTSIEHTILASIRLPRIFLGLAVGGALGLAGVILQGIYRNPLVEPYTLGISGGAALGVAFTIVFGLHIAFGSMMLPLSGFIGAIIMLFMVYFISMQQGKIDIQKMVLIGVMVSFIASSTMMFLMATTTTENLHGIVFWVMGSLDETDTNLITIVAVAAIASLVATYFFIQPLNALRLGEYKARTLGINTDLAIKVLFVIASLLTGITVAVAGIIGFVGLIIPHLMRMIVGTDYRILLLSSFLSGGIFVVFCDTLARTIILPNELPIGAITGMIGGLAFILILSNENRKSRKESYE